MTSVTGSDLTNSGRIFESVSIGIIKGNKFVAGQTQECVTLTVSESDFLVS